MGLAFIAFALVALGALALASKALDQTRQSNYAMTALLADVIAAGRADVDANREHLAAAISRAHGSLGMALADVTKVTAGAIGQAVATATAPPPAPLYGGHDPAQVARDVARRVVADDRTFEEPVDDTDPTDAWISPERQDAEFVHTTDANPTGLPGFAFDTPDPATALPFEIPAGLHLAAQSNGHQ